MAKKPISKKPVAKKGGKRRFGMGGVMTAKDMLRSAIGSGDAGDFPVRSASAAGESGLPAVRGSRDVTRPGRPTIDVDLRGRGPAGEKLAGSGSGIKDPIPEPKRLAGPSARAAAPAASRLGMLGRGLAGTAGIGALALMPDVHKEAPDADKPRNYGANEGLQMPAKKALLQDAADVGPPRPLNRATGNAPAPVKKITRRKAASSDDDAFLADLRASAARMKDATSDMADKTGKMKASAEKFAGSFKKGGKAAPKCKGYAAGGAVKSRGDGLAQRGRTKGRMI